MVSFYGPFQSAAYRGPLSFLPLPLPHFSIHSCPALFPFYFFFFSAPRMHFVVNEAGTEKLFVLDYSRQDAKDPEISLYGRIAFSSVHQPKIFSKLKETMVALAKAEQQQQ